MLGKQENYSPRWQDCEFDLKEGSVFCKSWLISFKEVSGGFGIFFFWSVQSVCKKHFSEPQRYLQPTFKILSVTKHNICFSLWKNLFSLLEAQYDKFWQAQWFSIFYPLGRDQMLNKKFSSFFLQAPSTLELRLERILIQVRKKHFDSQINNAFTTAGLSFKSGC